jgi:DNA (cytosine-5)-methyltransferase 3A
MIKLLIGGSPCTNFSISQTKNRETKPGGAGYELFRNYVIARDKFKPDYFLFENVKSMSDGIKDAITQELGVESTMIDAALVSAQSRRRLYWVGKRVGEKYITVPIEQPADRGIMLRDIIESGVSDREKSYVLRLCEGNARDYIKKHETAVAFEPCIMQTAHGYNNGGAKYGKAPTMTSNGSYEDSNHIVEPSNAVADKAACLMAHEDKNGMYNIIANSNQKCNGIAQRIGTVEHSGTDKHDSKGFRVYSADAKSTNLCGQGGGMGAKTGLYAVSYDGNTTLENVYYVTEGKITYKGKDYPIKLTDGYYIIRKLTVKECCRLQTMPDDYCRAVSNSRAYRGLGNGWCAEVIIHILTHMFKDIPLDARMQVLSMYDGIGTGRYCLDKLGYTNVEYTAYEIDKYVMQVALSNYPDIQERGDAFQVRGGGWHVNLSDYIQKSM